MQPPVAVVGLACRLPGNCNSPRALWDFIKQGKIASPEPPLSRFNIKGHYHGSGKPATMNSPGGMFIQDVDPAEFDARFFNVGDVDAATMDPQQRQLLEVSYECLENSGVTLEEISGTRVGCVVASFTGDYEIIQGKDPETQGESMRPGVSRSIMSNRISHFLDLKGPSMTVDTACSGSLVAIDVACRYIQTGQVDGMIVCGVNLYLDPLQNQDLGLMKATASRSGKCHSFDAKADGYMRAEGVNAVFLKRLDCAVRDNDPIRAVIRGTATNSDGRTPGLTNPSSAAQATAIVSAYENAGITDLDATGFLECHGTGTLAGDPTEVAGVASVFAMTRNPDHPLVIGSIKSNIGHSESASGISGLIKAILAVESGTIPGNPTFIDPNPAIDFEKSRVQIFRKSAPWPKMPIRRAGVNSFGFGGSNAHVIVEQREVVGPSHKTYAMSYDQANGNFFDLDDDDEVDDDLTSSKPRLIILSANNETSLKDYTQVLKKHLIDPRVSVKLGDLAYTLSEKRSRHFYRAFAVTRSIDFNANSYTIGKIKSQETKIGFIFTGQGAQWSQMGKSLIDNFPTAKAMIQRLDTVLQKLPCSPEWSLLAELTEKRTSEELRLPEFSQPLVTALQLGVLAVLNEWGIKAERAVGHSSGEIAASVAAGLLDPETAIKVAFLRGQAAKNLMPTESVGMLAVGVTAEDIVPYLEESEGLVQIACFNSPRSLTLSGASAALEKICDRLKESGSFARMLQVNLAYHSRFMAPIAEYYEKLVESTCPLQTPDAESTTAMFSSVTGHEMDQSAGAAYWRLNLESPVRFSQALSEMLNGSDAPNYLIEIGPSNALSGPTSQVLETLPGGGRNVIYNYALKRDTSAEESLYNVVGQLFINGASVDFAKINEYDNQSCIVDLPNYQWDHSKKHWHEGLASQDWRYKPFVTHDLLGTKVHGTSWNFPSWLKELKLNDMPWLKDHKIGDQVVFPAAGYIAMAVEASRQHMIMTQGDKMEDPQRVQFRLKDLKFERALIIEDRKPKKIMLNLTPVPGALSAWCGYTVMSLDSGSWTEHCSGQIAISTDFVDRSGPARAHSQPQYMSPATSWYRIMANVGNNFGEGFQAITSVGSMAPENGIGTALNLEPPSSIWEQSTYPIHPVAIDGCIQSMLISAWGGDSTNPEGALVPAFIGHLTISDVTTSRPSKANCVSTSKYVGVGDKEALKNLTSSCNLYEPETGREILEVRDLRLNQLGTQDDAVTSHVYLRSMWDADVTLTNPSKLSGSTAQRIIDFCVHKAAPRHVLEINLDLTDKSSLWLSGPAHRFASSYHFISGNPQAVLEVQDSFPDAPNTTFSLIDITTNSSALSDQKFDLIITKTPVLESGTAEKILKILRNLVSDNGLTLFVEPATSSSHFEPLLHTVSENGYINGRKFIDQEGGNQIVLAEATAQTSATPRAAPHPVALFSFLEQPTRASKEITAGINAQGWLLAEYSSAKSIPAKSDVLILDELSVSVLEAITGPQWDMIHQLVERECNILWVTQGSQFQVTEPNKAMVHGLMRVLRREEPQIRFITLDVENSSGANTIDAISSCLNLLITSKSKDYELVERQGVLYVSRILPDGPLNEAKFEETRPKPTITKDLYDQENSIRLRTGHLGNIDSLYYEEVSPRQLPLGTNQVEVELHAAGVNSRDLDVVLGGVPSDKYSLGIEGAGIITRVAIDVTNVKPGQRVVVMANGSFGNRIQTTSQRVYPIPNSMSFDDAATLPFAYLTAIYALIRLGNLRDTQRVLIHSGASAVGQAAIYLSRHIGAEIFTTVETDEERKFLKVKFGLSDGHVFSSQTPAFAEQIMSLTNGRGIDCILNSLTAELLEATWSLVADNGILIEIGKRDNLDRKTLPMEPFQRNASFRSLDISHPDITDDTIANLFTGLFRLIAEGTLEPLEPIQPYAFDDVPSALHAMNDSVHFGKLILSRTVKKDLQVPVQPSPRELRLRSNACYLIAGGLKGLCGSIAKLFAKHGAKHVALVTRSGHDDDKSQAVAREIQAMGCQVHLLRGDVNDVESIRKVFKAVPCPIKGIVQGAMVLRDRPFNIMTVDEYHATLQAKNVGTWNLHRVALEQSNELEFFTMLSSISDIVGRPGQANYCAANAFLDAFANYRHGLGLPACAVNLGLIQDVGLAAQEDGILGKFNLLEKFEAEGWYGINERLMHKIMRFATLQQMEPVNLQSATQLISGLQVPQPETSPLKTDQRFGGLFISDSHGPGSGSAKGDGGGSNGLRELLLLLRSNAEQSAILTLMVGVLGEYIATVLRISEAMDPERPLSAYGIDSLAAMEVRNWVRVELGAPLQVFEVMNANSLAALSENIMSKVIAAAAN
ncbi:putative polyketide synthase [Xylariales sp. PMI_506]|nr:putative polyketide synthase [Xylariales sp. PMI_506]